MKAYRTVLLACLIVCLLAGVLGVAAYAAPLQTSPWAIGTSMNPMFVSVSTGLRPTCVKQTPSIIATSGVVILYLDADHPKQWDATNIAYSSGIFSWTNERGERMAASGTIVVTGDIRAAGE